MPKHTVDSFDSLKSLISELKGRKIYILFTATKDENAACPLIKKTDAVTGNYYNNNYCF